MKVHQLKNKHGDTQKINFSYFIVHPEVTGKKGEDCSKCGMELTEPVVQKNHLMTIAMVHDHNDNSTVEPKVVETTQTSSTQFFYY